MTRAHGNRAGVIPMWTQGDLLRKSREFAGLSQDDLAEAIGLSRRTIGSYEADTRPVKRAVILAWAMATGVDLNWLENGESPHPDKDPNGGVTLPRLDSNQQPSD